MPAIFPATSSSSSQFSPPRAAQAQWTGKAELGLLLVRRQHGVQVGQRQARHRRTRERSGATASTPSRAVRRERGILNAERYEARYQADYKITDRLSWFVGLRGEQDHFSGFAYQATVSTGATYKFIDNPTTKFDASLGAGYRQLQPQMLIKTDAGEVLERIKGEEENDPVATLGSNFEHAFTENTKITNKFLSELGSDEHLGGRTTLRCR